MSRIIDLLLTAAFFVTCALCLYLGNQHGESTGYDRGRLSVFQEIMGGAVMNMGALPVPEIKHGH